MPGSCQHQMGHYPLQQKKKMTSTDDHQYDETKKQIGGVVPLMNSDVSFLEYVSEDEKMPHNNDPLVPGPFKKKMIDISSLKNNQLLYITSYSHVNVLPFGNALHQVIHICLYFNIYFLICMCT